MDFEYIYSNSIRFVNIRPSNFDQIYLHFLPFIGFWLCETQATKMVTGIFLGKGKKNTFFSFFSLLSFYCKKKKENLFQVAISIYIHHRRHRILKDLLFTWSIFIFSLRWTDIIIIMSFLNITQKFEKKNGKPLRKRTKKKLFWFWFYSKFVWRKNEEKKRSPGKVEIQKIGESSMMMMMEKVYQRTEWKKAKQKIHFK